MIRRAVALAGAALALAASCGASTRPPTRTPARPTTPSMPVASPESTGLETPGSSSTTATIPAPTTVPLFASQVTSVSAAQLGATWHPGCPVDPGQLRDITLSYWGFDGQTHSGSLVVNTEVVAAVTDIFQTLYDARFPIREMVPESAYGGDDNAAAAADDTSGFNCRDAVAPGPPQWSVHAYGEAIDVNDVENPYVDGATVIPPVGAPYEDRSNVRPGMAEPGGTLVNAFAAVGWQWGGRWSDSPDYQHFSANGG